MQGNQHELVYPAPPSASRLYQVQQSFQALSISEYPARQTQQPNPRTDDIDMDVLVTSMNRSGLYSRPFLGTCQSQEDVVMENPTQSSEPARAPFAIVHPPTPSAFEARLQSINGSLMAATISETELRLPIELRTFRIAPQESMNNAVRAVLDGILRGGRSRDITKANIERVAKLLYSESIDKNGTSRTRSVICRRVMRMLEKLIADTISRATPGTAAAAKEQVGHYRFCLGEFRKGISLQVVGNLLFWKFACSHPVWSQDTDDNAAFIGEPLSQFADLHAAGLISPSDFLDGLEKYVLPSATTPFLLFIAVFAYISRGLSNRSLKLFPATWANVHSAWRRVRSKCRASRVVTSPEWEYMETIKAAIVVFEEDSAIQGEPSSLVPFIDEACESQADVCNLFISDLELR